MRWEYKIVYFGFDPILDEKHYEVRLHDGIRTLNELGEQGWELVQFLEHQLSKDILKSHAVFKKPREDSVGETGKTVAGQ